MVAGLLTLDLLLTTGERAESRRWALVWSVVWIGVGLIFVAVPWLLIDSQAAAEYLTVFLLEKSLSLDNLFVFLVIFESLNLAKRYQHKVLFWGIIGAVVFRGIFIFAGAAALETFHEVIYLFATLLLYAAWQAFRENPLKATDNRILHWLSQHLPVSKYDHEGRFISEANGRRVLTTLALALVAVELSDIMFAIDSVAAALSITKQRFVIYSANIFAILGLRALYLLLAHLIRDWAYLHYGIAAVLGFTGVKLLLDGIVEIPIWLSLLVIVTSIAVAIYASVRTSGQQRAESYSHYD